MELRQITQKSQFRLLYTIQVTDAVRGVSNTHYVFSIGARLKCMACNFSPSIISPFMAASAFDGTPPSLSLTYLYPPTKVVCLLVYSKETLLGV